MESYDFTCLRVKLRKQNWNNDDIDQLFAGCYDVNELKNFKKIVNICYNIVNDCVGGDKESLVLVKSVIEWYLANKDISTTRMCVTANKDKGYWEFEVL